MIQHLLQLIWNQRKQNAWLWAELLLVSVFLWFLVDYLYVMGRTYTAPLGFDIRHTYSIVISSLSERSPDYIPKEKRERPDGVHLLTALDRIRTYPGVDEVRALAEKSLDEAVLAAMRQKLAYVIKSGSALDPRTAHALEWLENKLSK